MYARSITLQGRPEAMDEVIRFIRDEAMPMAAGIEGYVGVSMLCDRQSGRCIVTTSWESQEAMDASRDRLAAARARAGELLSDDSPGVREWEVAAMHRAHEGHDDCCTRVVWGESDPSRAEDNLSTFRMAMMPRLEELPGFCSVSLLVDRATGASAMATTYDSREDMEGAVERAASMREEFSQALGVRITDMAEFDLVLHHLRVPETV